MRKKLDRLSFTLGTLMKARGMQGRLSEYRIFGVWEKTVGSVIAGHARPLSLRGTRLYLAVDSPAWMQQLSLLKPDIIDKVNRALGKDAIREISLSIGEVQPEDRMPAPGSGTAPIELTADERAKIEDTVSAIGDPAVRQAMRRVMEKDFSRKKGKS